MKIKILTFAKGNFIESQNKLSQVIKTIGDFEIINKTDNDLDYDFKKNHNNILKHTKGYGYCIWKPYIILNELKLLKDDEILIYIDSTDLPSNLFFDYVKDYFLVNDLLLVNRGFINGQWTKRDCFVYMDSDDEEYYNSIQLEAGIIGLKKNEFNINLIEEWFSICKDERILVDSDNVSGLPNLSNYNEHRYDQSILTNLAIKYKLNSVNITTNLIKYNYNQPKKYS